MKKTIREELTDILNNSFGNPEKGIIFSSSATRRRSAAGRKIPKNQLKTSQSWSAESVGSESFMVCCVGMTMTEFIKEAKNNNVHYTPPSDSEFPNITLFRNTPEWPTTGYVTQLSPHKDAVSIHIADILTTDEISTKITAKTPKWITNLSQDQYPVFDCKIYQSWRFLSKFDFPEWGKVWETFKLKYYLSKAELKEDFCFVKQEG